MALPQVWRPHCKAIRTPQIAKLLVEHGAVGVTCAKLSQAEALLDGGIEDVPHRAANPRGASGASRLHRIPTHFRLNLHGI
jgi:D-serine deaminase-like pyridoxal phosphate-dependent protein